MSIPDFMKRRYKKTPVSVPYFRMILLAKHYGTYTVTGTIDWEKLAFAIARDCMPGMHQTGAVGRMPVDHSGLVRAVDGLLEEGKAKSVRHACDILGNRGEYDDLADLRSAYKRFKKKMK